LDAIVSDACVAISVALQSGRTLKEMAEILGQLRPEGWKDGDPLGRAASPLGTIVRTGAVIEQNEMQIRSSGTVVVPLGQT
jgi:hypothetical protein